MTDYISKEEFIKSQCHKCDGACDVIECDCLNCKSDYRCDMIQELMEFPAADVEERKKGRWIRPTRVPDSMLDECSLCGFDTGTFSFNFCPNCGARMVK